MTDPEPSRPLVARRRVLGVTAALPVVAVACRSGGGDDSRAAGSGDPTTTTTGSAATSTDPLPLTPACDDDPTPAQTEGPFFSSGAPERSSLREDGDGTLLLVEGAVVSPGCEPLAGARMEFWHTDDDGEYDNTGYRFRGHLFTDELGRFRLETIVPGLYTGRTRHIHVKVQPDGGNTLTTQLYFPGEPGNDGDGIFDERLLMTMGEDADGSRLGAFTFVLQPT